jgi:hypothetical protein
MMDRSVVAVGNKLIVLGTKMPMTNNIGGIYQFVSKEGPKAMPWIPLLLLDD